MKLCLIVSSWELYTRIFACHAILQKSVPQRGTHNFDELCADNLLTTFANREPFGYFSCYLIFPVESSAIWFKKLAQ